jgi:hypothetical protein
VFRLDDVSARVGSGSVRVRLTKRRCGESGFEQVTVIEAVSC